MTRSLTSRRFPRWLSVVLSALLALYWVPTLAVSAASAQPAGTFQFTLEGCRLSTTGSLPNGAGQFVCANGEYTTGNLGKLWNELDLVPHRLTVSGSGTVQVVVAADNKDAGAPGYDVMSAPVVNTALSTDSCAVTAGDQTAVSPGQGGADTSIYRLLAITVPSSGTCVLDWYERLALGSHLYPGSSLHTNLLSPSDVIPGGTTTNVGSKEVSIPVKEILPQQLAKTMTATQGTDYTWTVEKTATPASLSFPNTCTSSTEPKSQQVSITIDWTRSAATASGDVQLTTKITATNPAHRDINVTVTDAMYAGTTQTTPPLSTQSGTATVGPESSHTFTFTKTVSSSSSTYNDLATATYTDVATGIAVPGTTQATATATVAPSGSVTNATATISDTESISGTGFSYSVDSVNSSGGGFGGYTTGTKTTDDVTWTSAKIAPSGTGAASGSFTFTKTVYVAPTTSGSGTLSDTATLNGSDGFTASDEASVALTASAPDPQLRFHKLVDIAPDQDATFTFTVWPKDSQGDKVGTGTTFTVVVKAGETAGYSGYVSMPPSDYGYLYEESAASGYTGVDGSVMALGLCDQYTQDVDNRRDMGQIAITKSFDGPVAGASTDVTVHVDCSGTAYDQDVALNEGNGWASTTGDIPTGTTCTVSEPQVPSGWALKSITPSSVTVGLGDPVSVAVVNTRLMGELTVIKTREGDVAGASTDFTAHVDCTVDAYDHTLALNAGNGWSQTLSIPSGVACTVTETAVPEGWSLTSISPAGWVTIAAGQTVSVEITNTRDMGDVLIEKTWTGDVAGAGTSFTAGLDCDVDTYDQDVVLNDANGWQQFVSMPTGVSCSVTETAIPDGWALMEISPDEFTVAGYGDDAVHVVITNERQMGQLTVTKSIDGDVAGASTDFTAHVDCTVDAYDRDVALNEGNGWSKTLSIPSGVACQVTEPAVTPGWALESISPEGWVTIGAGQTVSVEVTNQRVVSGVTVTKVREGDVAGASTDFTAVLDCDGTAYDHNLALNAGNNWSQTVSIPSGVACTVDEPVVPEGWTLASITPAEFTVAGQTVSVKITNTRDTGVITVEKSLVGDAAGASTQFLFDVDCPGVTYDQTVQVDVTEGSSATGTTSVIPTGLSCTVTEQDSPDWNLTTVVPANGVVLVGGTVSFTNERQMGQLTVTKSIKGDVAGASTDFTAHVDCTVDAYDKDVALNEGNGWSQTLSIPTGVACSVAETDVPAGWALVDIVPDGPVTVSSEPATVTVTNERVLGQITITKVALGDAAGASTDFTAHLDCTVDVYDQDVALNKGNDWTQTITVPTGVTCTVTEPTSPQGWSLTSIDPATVTVTDEGAAQVAVFNTRDTGVITVEKSLVGDVAGASTQFLFDVDCPGVTYDQTVQVDVTEGSSATGTTSAIPTGLSCTVTEQDSPDWNLTAVVPANGVVAVGGTVSFTNTRKVSDLVIAKTVDLATAEFGDTLTYTLKVTASGDYTQQSVKVTDYIPGYDPARPASGTTTYVADSAACDGTCTASYDAATHLLTWELGDMAAGTSRTVTFRVTIDTPVAAADGGIPAVDILNAGAVESNRIAKRPSNEVRTSVVAVQGVKIIKPPAKPGAITLPRTGPQVPLLPMAGTAVLLIGLGIALAAAARRREG